MSAWARTALALALLALAAGAAPAQRRVVLLGPVGGGDTLRTITPTFAIATEGFAPADKPLRLRLEIGRDPGLSPLTLVADTSVQGDGATLTLRRPLPERVRIYWRAVAYTAGGDSVLSETTGPRVVRPWLVLVSPNVPSGTTLETRRPTFVWSSAQADVPPGPWVYTFELFATTAGDPLITVPGLLDTTFTPAFDLEANVSFRWSVTARLTTGEQVTVPSAATFVIVDPGQPRATLLFQNFPNPFPSVSSRTTCVWFDLRDPSIVTLTVYDLRGNLVRTIIPSADLSGALSPGRYGRAPGAGDAGGCDARFSWDGVAADGRVVPAGVYLLRLTANGKVFLRKILFNGR